MYFDVGVGAIQGMHFSQEFADGFMDAEID